MQTYLAVHTVPDGVTPYNERAFENRQNAVLTASQRSVSRSAAHGM